MYVYQWDNFKDTLDNSSIQRSLLALYIPYYILESRQGIKCLPKTVITTLGTTTTSTSKYDSHCQFLGCSTVLNNAIYVYSLSRL